MNDFVRQNYSFSVREKVLYDDNAGKNVSENLFSQILVISSSYLLSYSSASTPSSPERYFVASVMPERSLGQSM